LDRCYFRRPYNAFEFPLLFSLPPNVLNLRLCCDLEQLALADDPPLVELACVAFALAHAAVFDRTCLHMDLFDLT
jgi:hypothetical protein